MHQISEEQLMILFRRWINELKSGEWEQGHEELKQEKEDGDGHKYCCLGVLCEVIPGVDWEKKPHHSHLKKQGEKWYAQFKDDESYFVVPPSLVRQLGADPDFFSELVNMNDGLEGYEPHSFEEIAEFLESEVLEKT